MKCHRCGMSKQAARSRCLSCGAAPTSISSMEIDEVSFVPRGANQAAHIVLHKADTGAQRDREQVTLAGLRRDLDYAAEATAGSREFIRTLAERDAAHSGLSIEQCIARLYEQHEWAYAAENQASEMVSLVQSQRSTS